MNLRQFRTLFFLSLGSLAGLLTPTLYHSMITVDPCSDDTNLDNNNKDILRKRSSARNTDNLDNNALQKNKLLFAGVMTAEKFLDTRAKAVYETWGKIMPGKIMFFSSSSSGRRDDLPVVSLSGVDDSYPPQRKSMMMLKYMHDNFIDQYEWFLRSDDDVYVRTDKLERFLRQLNSSDDLYIGNILLL